MAGPADREYDYREIDEVIHGRVRLAIMAYLSGADGASFGELQRLAQVSEGNLSVHLRKLEEAGYIHVEKRFVGRKPQTLCRLSRAGREAWIAYMGHMQKLIGSGDSA